MIPAILILIFGLVSATAMINALRPVRWDLLLLPSLLWSWAIIELPGQLVVVQVMAAGVLIWAGALTHAVGVIGLVILIVSWAGLAVLFVRSRGSRRVVRQTLDRAGISRHGTTIPMWRVLLAVPFAGRGVVKTKDIAFSRVAGRVLKLDVYRSRDGGGGRPALLYLHGGAWAIGDKREQGLPMMHHLARNGWVCFTANYRLSPGATFPDHLVDAKAALIWIKENAEEYGVDPSFVAVAGGSAGGHLASLVALTAGDPRYQQGSELSDTSVQAAISIYGISDLTNRLSAQSDRFVSLIMQPMVMKAFLDEEPERYRDGSPIDRVHPGAPPFLVVQGDRDTLAPVVEARAFVARLREVSRSEVVYMEFPGAQHGFDLIYSYRSARMIEGATAFLEDVRSRRATVQS